MVGLLAEPHRAVRAGDPLFRTRDPLLESRLRVLAAERRELALRTQALTQTNPVQAEITRERLVDAEAALARAAEQASEVVVRSPTDGVFVLVDGRDPVGRHVAQGEVLGYVVDLDEASVRVVVSHEKMALMRRGTGAVKVSLAHDPGRVIDARIRREVPAASNQLPTPVLGTSGGGPVSVDPSDPEGLRTLEPIFLFELTLPPSSVRAAGERAHVRFSHGAEPVGRRLRARRAAAVPEAARCLAPRRRWARRRGREDAALYARPGVRAAHSPNVPERHPPFASRALRVVQGLVRVPRSVSRRAVAAFAARVEAEAAGLEELDETGLDRQVASLRAQLRREGVREATLPLEPSRWSVRWRGARSARPTTTCSSTAAG